MAQSKFTCVRQSDRRLLESAAALAADLPPSTPGHALTVHFLEGAKGIMVANVGDYKSAPALTPLLDQDTAFIVSLSLSVPNIEGSLSLKRDQHYDLVSVNLADRIPPEQQVSTLLAVQRHFRPFGIGESLEKALGAELAEFYQRRENTLAHLEQLSERLIEQNVTYRSTLDLAADGVRQELQTDHEARATQLREEHERKLADLEARESKLSARSKELDDRDSRHARRQIRLDLKRVLAERETTFSLTEATVRKRIPVHILSSMLVLGAAIALAIVLLREAGVGSDWFDRARLGVAALAFAAATTFYIRWNDAWFKQHADEEFRLKRLDLDIDRASWAVEVALEWLSQKGEPIPQELIGRLTANLFEEQTYAAVRHPAEDLATTIQNASGLKLSIPGVGEATFDRAGVRRLNKEIERKPD